MVDLVTFEQIATYVAPVALAAAQLVAGFVVQDMPWAHEASLHEFVAQHAGGFSKVVELDASSLGTLTENQELLVVVWHPLDANALGAVGSDEDAPALAVGISYRHVCQAHGTKLRK